MNHLFFKVLFFISFTLYFILKDEMLWKCKSAYGKTLFVIHHFVISVNLFSGLLFNLNLLNIIIVVLTASSWLIMDKCFISIMHNKLCGQDNKDFLHIGTLLREYIGNKLNIKIHYMWELIILFIILCYNIIMIRNK